jgi:hypothetical protein
MQTCGPGRLGKTQPDAKAPGLIFARDIHDLSFRDVPGFVILSEAKNPYRNNYASGLLFIDKYQ